MNERIVLMEQEAGPTGVTNEAAVGLPPLSERRRDTWDYYRIEFADDGYPGRRTESGWAPHPMYGAYVIGDYIGRWRTQRVPELVAAATRVADAAVARMERRGDALVFSYPPGLGLHTMAGSFYSALTQARYLGVLGKLAEARGDDRFDEAIHGVLQSLIQPVEDGGAARRTPGGALLLEEYPNAMPDYTLNGWTTATLLVHEHLQRTDDPLAQQIFDESVAGIIEMLPRYDLGELHNSRYRLTGQARLLLRPASAGCQLLDGSVTMPGQGEFPLAFGGKGKWENRVLRGLDDEKHLVADTELQVLTCRVSWPLPTTVELRMQAAEPTGLEVLLGHGHYRPTANQLLVDDFHPLLDHELPAGESLVRFEIPWDRIELVAYPTSFTKLIGGRRRNSYHWIHINTLDQLAQITGSPLIGYYARRWRSFTDQWPSTPPYSDDENLVLTEKA